MLYRYHYIAAALIYGVVCTAQCAKLAAVVRVRRAVLGSDLRRTWRWPKRTFLWNIRSSTRKNERLFQRGNRSVYHSVAWKCLHCCTSDHPILWRYPEIWLAITQKPLNRLTKNLVRRRWLTACRNSKQSPHWGILAYAWNKTLAQCLVFLSFPFCDLKFFSRFER